MSALMPETNRKNCVDPTVFPMRRQNTSNQTPANASTSAAQLINILQNPWEPYTISPHKPLGENLQNWLHTVITHVQDNQKDFEAPTARPSTWENTSNQTMQAQTD